MFRFNHEQRVVEIGGVSLGGQPGEYPTVMVGSIFFAGHRIVNDPVKGEFDTGRATALLENQAAAAAATNLPYFIDVLGDTTEALIRYLEFVAARTTAPLLVDSPSQAVRLEALRHFAGTEVMPRLIYNAIADDHTEEEINTLRECGVKHAVALAFNTRNVRPAARVNFLTETLLPVAARAGIENLIVDTGVLDIASLGPAAIAIREVKEKLGYPSGCAPANALYTWRQGTGRDWDDNAYKAVAASIMSTLVNNGADFIFYGSLALAPWLYPAVAVADALIAYAGRFTGNRPKGEVSEHPLRKML
jgi:tetrahydromethanopterin S-methyltransferase subunit H